MPRPNTVTDFWSQVKKSARCWLWAGTSPDGRYGRFGIGGKKHATHRYSYELAKGPIPEGLEVCHSCDVTLCVRPSHLFLGTHKENMADMVKKNRLPGKHGEQNPKSIINAEMAIEIRSKYAAGHTTQKDLAAEFGVGQTQISKIILRKAWNHI